MAEIPAEFLSFHNAELVVGSFSLIANSMLLYLILFKTPKELLEYRPFVFMVTLSDFLFDIYVIFLLRPVMIFPLLGAIITGPIQVFGSDVVHYLAMLGIFMFDYCMLCVNLAFLYRYTCIAQKPFHHFFTHRRTQILSHAMLIGIILPVLIYPVMSKESHKAVVDVVENLIPSLKGHVDELVIVAVHNDNVWVFINIVLLPLPSCILNAMLAYLIVRKLRSYRSSFSAETYRMHLRMAACLLCQTFSPIILFAFPTIIALYVYITDKDAKKIRLVSSGFIFTIACHALLNALCTLYFVQPYRRVLTNGQWIRFVQSKFCAKNKTIGQHSPAPAIVAMEIRGQIVNAKSMPEVNVIAS